MAAISKNACYRYLDDCNIVGGASSPDLTDCDRQMDRSCSSFVREDCTYPATEILR